MAGTEKRGFSASRADLFRGAPWWIVPGRSSPGRPPRPGPRGGGGRAAVVTDARTHDRAMAFLSHAPQVVAWALLDAARGDAVARRHLPPCGAGVPRHDPASPAARARSGGTSSRRTAPRCAAPWPRS